MPSTAKLAMPYPDLTNAPNVPADIQALATRLEVVFGDGRGETPVTASSASTVAAAELTLATSPVLTLNGTTKVVVAFSWYNITLTVGTDSFVVRLYDGATQIAQWYITADAGGMNGGSGHLRSTTLTPAAGAHTYTAKLQRNTGTGTASLFASAVAPASISIAPG